MHLPTAYFQPVAADDVAAVVGRQAVGDPTGGIVETGGPVKVRMNEFVSAALARIGDPRTVVGDPRATYFGTELEDDSLVPGPEAVLGATTYEHWVAAQAR